ncbi:MAG: hypothetical protein COT91_01760 [Candidatus Doudnabacteria bacterium CG10_big_fil_rev_8_21_14_0_10_41_10]|uniref:Uncharacterized protein n=1 Tax=Candidatus Doudnabacteria bacterium CG10_big_fil_rev_8_21_14_0_10_41_10 TaxID=1974551 RepID=A0A2H0VG84_9BACT|nr:MAG: hypothetical protein COT91_01760 [Candidatus Doudnabacteria bacterium CG10_big_fil_rev_8_21_14_0_10_41_10]
MRVVEEHNYKELILSLLISSIFFVVIHFSTRSFTDTERSILFFLLSFAVLGFINRKLLLSYRIKSMTGNPGVFFALLSAVLAIYLIIYGINLLIAYGFVVLVASGRIFVNMQNLSSSESKETKKAVSALSVLFVVAVIVLGYMIFT